MYQVSKIKTGERIRALIARNGLTVRDVQEAMGLESLQAVYKWMNGRALPSVENLLTLCSLLRVPVEGLLVMEDVDTKKREEWEKSHPPIFLGCYVTSTDPVRREDSLRLMPYLEYPHEERMRAARSMHQPKSSS